MDNTIFAFPSNTETNQLITEIEAKFDIEYQGTLDDFIDVNIDSLPNGNIKLLQPHSIEQIVQDLNIAQRAPPCSTPEKFIGIILLDLSVTSFD